MNEPLFKIGTEIIYYLKASKTNYTGIIQSIEYRPFHGYCYTLVFNGNRIIVTESDLTMGFLAQQTKY